jgi:peroxiredoxin
MNLQDAMNAFRNEFLTKIPPEAVAIMDRATEALAIDFDNRQSLTTGDVAPDFTLPNAVGANINLQERLSKGAVILTFYRGNWCPYCNLELRAYQQLLPEIQKLGASLIAVSPQTPDASLSTAEKNDLDFDVLSDVGSEIAKAYRVAFTLPEELQQLYTQWGIILPNNNGTNHWTLPVPATFVIAPDGKIVLAHLNVDYTQRLEPSKALAAIKNIVPVAA